MTQRTVELRVDDFLAALGEKTPAPASGSATAVVGAMAGALAEEDAVAYTAFMADRTEANRRRTIEIPEELAAAADEIAEVAEHVAAQLRTAVRGDAEAAAELARAAARVARRLAELNA